MLAPHQTVTWLVGVLMVALKVFQVHLEEVQGEKKAVVHQACPEKWRAKQKVVAGQMGMV